jgi:hypothetical protein
MNCKSLLIACYFFLFLSPIYADQFYIGIWTYDDSVHYNFSNDRLAPLSTDYKFNMIIPYHQLFTNGRKYSYAHIDSTFIIRANNNNLKVMLCCPSLGFLSRDDSTYDCYNGYVKTNWYNASLVDKSVEKFGNMSGLVGWQIVDEPGSKHFSAIDTIYDRAKLNTSKILFSDLLPDYIKLDQLINGKGHESGDWSTLPQYNGYFANYISTVNPEVICLDYYPIFEKSSKKALKMFYVYL